MAPTRTVAALASTPATAPASRPAVAPSGTAAAGASGAVVTLPKPEQTTLKIGLTTLEASQLAAPLAADLGVFKKYGFDNVEQSYFDGDAKGMQGLVGGQLDASFQSTGSVIASQTTDVPTVMLALTSTILNDALVGASDVKSAADLKGKKIAVSTFGSTAHGSILLALKALGLTANDVTIVQIGGQSARLAALKAGTVAAAPIDALFNEEMKQQGFNILISLPDTPLEFGRSGLAVRRDWMERNPNATLALVAATLEGQNAIWTRTDQAVDSLAKWAQLQDRAQAQAQVNSFLTLGRRDLRWSKDAFLLAQDVQATANPIVKNVDVTRAYDTRWLDRLKEIGFNAAIGLPGS